MDAATLKDPPALERRVRRLLEAIALPKRPLAVVPEDIPREGFRDFSLEDLYPGAVDDFLAVLTRYLGTYERDPSSPSDRQLSDATRALESLESLVEAIDQARNAWGDFIRGFEPLLKLIAAPIWQGQQVQAALTRLQSNGSLQKGPQEADLRQTLFALCPWAIEPKEPRAFPFAGNRDQLTPEHLIEDVCRLRNLADHRGVLPLVSLVSHLQTVLTVAALGALAPNTLEAIKHRLDRSGSRVFLVGPYLTGLATRHRRKLPPFLGLPDIKPIPRRLRLRDRSAQGPGMQAEQLNREPLSVLQDSPKACIVGEGGCGKTWLFVSLLEDQAAVSMRPSTEERQRLLPVLIPLRSYVPGQVGSTLEDLVRRELGLGSSDGLPRPSRLKFFLLLDGLNEIPHGASQCLMNEIERLENLLPIAGCWFSTRPGFEAPPGWTQFELSPPTFSERFEHVEGILRSEGGVEGLQLLRDGWLSGATRWDNMLLLTLAAAQVSHGGEAANIQEGDLLSKLVDQYFDRERRSGAVGQAEMTVREALSAIAWEMAERGRSGFTRVEFEEALGRAFEGRWGGVSGGIESLERSILATGFMMQEGETFGFWHDRLADFFASEQLISMRRTGVALKTILSRLDRCHPGEEDDLGAAVAFRLTKLWASRLSAVDREGLFRILLERARKGTSRRPWPFDAALAAWLAWDLEARSERTLDWFDELANGLLESYPLKTYDDREGYEILEFCPSERVAIHIEDGLLARWREAPLEERIESLRVTRQAEEAFDFGPAAAFFDSQFFYPWLRLAPRRAVRFLMSCAPFLEELESQGISAWLAPTGFEEGDERAGEGLREIVSNDCGSLEWDGSTRGIPSVPIRDYPGRVRRIAEALATCPDLFEEWVEKLKMHPSQAMWDVACVSLACMRPFAAIVEEEDELEQERANANFDAFKVLVHSERRRLNRKVTDPSALFKNARLLSDFAWKADKSDVEILGVSLGQVWRDWLPGGRAILESEHRAQSELRGLIREVVGSCPDDRWGSIASGLLANTTCEAFEERPEPPARLYREILGIVLEGWNSRRQSDIERVIERESSACWHKAREISLERLPSKLQPTPSASSLFLSFAHVRGGGILRSKDIAYLAGKGAIGAIRTGPIRDLARTGLLKDQFPTQLLPGVEPDALWKRIAKDGASLRGAKLWSSACHPEAVLAKVQELLGGSHGNLAESIIEALLSGFRIEKEPSECFLSAPFAMSMMIWRSEKALKSLERIILSASDPFAGKLAVITLGLSQEIGLAVVRSKRYATAEFLLTSRDMQGLPSLSWLLPENLGREPFRSARSSNDPLVSAAANKWLERAETDAGEILDETQAS